VYYEYAITKKKRYYASCEKKFVTLGEKDVKSKVAARNGCDIT